MALKLDMMKAAAGLRLSLEKRGIHTPPSMELAFNLDVSGSFDDEHRGGLTQDLLTRLVPWGMVFDPDQKLDVFTFSDGEGNAHYVGDITPATSEGYIERKIIGKVPGYRGGTDYRHVLKKNLEHFGYINSAVSKPASGGVFKKFFGGSATVAAPVIAQKKRALVIHVTDGENDPNNSTDDKALTRQLLRESQERADQVYFLMLGASNQPSKFDYIKQLGDEFSNVGLVSILDIPQFVALSDQDLNEQLIGDELLEWLKK